MDVEWLEPWYEASDRERKMLEEEARREIHPNHVLWRIPLSLLARRRDQDEALFLLPDGRVAQVHLTWTRRREVSICPTTDVYGSLEEWVEQEMKPFHEEWVSTGG
jgi:hypothetical protein